LVQIPSRPHHAHGGGRSALRKLAAAIAVAPRDSAARLVSRIRVVGLPESAASPAAGVLQRAVVEWIAVELVYCDGEGRETTRVVEPAGIFGTRHGWYLAAWCRLRQGFRAFRLDRIVKAVLTGETIAPRPLDDVLAELPYELTQPAFG
jgi:predicted DNA-binding transcriptional regulator YafY